MGAVVFNHRRWALPFRSAPMRPTQRCKFASISAGLSMSEARGRVLMCLFSKWRPSVLWGEPGIDTHRRLGQQRSLLLAVG
jgi:hypothetical protein